MPYGGPYTKRAFNRHKAIGQKAMEQGIGVVPVLDYEINKGERSCLLTTLAFMPRINGSGIKTINGLTGLANLPIDGYRDFIRSYVDAYRLGIIVDNNEQADNYMVDDKNIHMVDYRARWIAPPSVLCAIMRKKHVRIAAGVILHYWYNEIRKAKKSRYIGFEESMGFEEPSGIIEFYGKEIINNLTEKFEAVAGNTQTVLGEIDGCADLARRVGDLSALCC